eukprot:COSAG05_NODE_10682_length_552_cov_0.852097_1_plen_119_part_10
MWYDDATLFSAAVIAQPSSAKARLTLGTIAARKAATAAAPQNIAGEQQRQQQQQQQQQQRHLAEAQAHFEAALNLYPTYADALYSLGRLQLETGGPPRRAEALLLLERAAISQPSHTQA